MCLNSLCWEFTIKNYGLAIHASCQGLFFSNTLPSQTWGITVLLIITVCCLMLQRVAGFLPFTSLFSTPIMHELEGKLSINFPMSA